MLRRVLFHLSESARARNFVVSHPLARRASRRFVAGETLDEAMALIDRLAESGYYAILNHLGERIAEPQEAENAVRDYLEALERLRGRPSARDCYVSVKLTQLGLDFDRGLAIGHLRRLLAAARQDGTFIRIDMEHSSYVDATLDIIEQMRNEGYERLGAVIQAYLYRSEADVDRLLRLGVPIRLVKGAYMEPPTIAYPRMEDVNACFLRIQGRLLRDRAYHAIGTHDEQLVEAAVAQARAEGIGADRFEFQFLYGVRRDLQARLAAGGWRVRLYVPYGTHWYPYFMRRMAEHPANLFFILRNVLRR
ncbi:MAG: proline dehydrogenase family protein [Armatimonadota bacterium]|nr:proline dehydrogenase family protein [Armatimonadota bacterium]